MLTVREVAQQFRPAILCITHAYGVCMIRRFLRHQRDMRTAEHDGLALGAKAVGKFI